MPIREMAWAVPPVATTLNYISDKETMFYKVIKAGLLAHMNGYAPQISVEFARKNIAGSYRPTFYELEEAINTLPPV